MYRIIKCLFVWLLLTTLYFGCSKHSTSFDNLIQHATLLPDGTELTKSEFKLENLANNAIDHDKFGVGPGISIVNVQDINGNKLNFTLIDSVNSNHVYIVYFKDDLQPNEKLPIMITTEKQNAAILDGDTWIYEYMSYPGVSDNLDYKVILTLPENAKFIDSDLKPISKVVENKLTKLAFQKIVVPDSGMVFSVKYKL